MAENMMVGSHTGSNEPYRDGWERIFGSSDGPHTHGKRAISRKVLNRIHIISRGSGKWAVRVGGGKRALKICDSKKAAIQYAESIRNGRHLVIHNRDGTVSEYIKK